MIASSRRVTTCSSVMALKAELRLWMLPEKKAGSAVDVVEAPGWWSPSTVAGEGGRGGCVTEAGGGGRCGGVDAWLEVWARSRRKDSSSVRMAVWPIMVSRSGWATQVMPAVLWGSQVRQRVGAVRAAADEDWDIQP
jgi:hypothetical protein